MSTYLYILAAVIIVPALFSSYRIRFYEKIPAVLRATLLTSLVFIPWDIYVTGRGEWGFNPGQVLPFRLLGLPLEEWLFFVVVPFACLFIYEALGHYYPQSNNAIKPAYFRVFVLVILLSGLVLLSVFPDRDYTLKVTLVFVCFNTFLLIRPPAVLMRLRTAGYLLLTFVAFFITNYFLTSIPVVIYNSQAISNLRIFTIPLEDFYYNYVLVVLYLMIYDYKWEKDKK